MHRRVLTIFAVAVLGTLVAAVSVTALQRPDPAPSSHSAASSR